MNLERLRVVFLEWVYPGLKIPDDNTEDNRNSNDSLNKLDVIKKGAGKNLSNGLYYCHLCSNYLK